MSGGSTGGVVRFSPTADDLDGADVTVVLDTTWMPPASTSAGRPGAPAPVAIAVRDVAERILAERDLLAETSAHLDRWAVASGVVDRLTIRDTSFWYYVRLRHWMWLQERILWASIADDIVRTHRPAEIVCSAGTDRALVDVLRLVCACRGVELRDETEPEPEPASAAEPAPHSPPGRRGDARRRDRRSRLRRIVASMIPPPLRARLRRRRADPRTARDQVIADRMACVEAMVAGLEAEPHGRLLVVHEHAMQRVDTSDGPRQMNPFLDPVVDRLRGTRLDPIVLDIRARLSDDAAWERCGAGRDPRSLPSDALAIGLPRTPSVGVVPQPDPAMTAWRDGLRVPVEVAGVDLGPLLAAEVAESASRWMPGMSRVIERIERFLRRIRPAAILLADEYHRQDWLAAAHTFGIPVAAIQHGMIYGRHNGYIHASRPATLRLTQRTYVFGRWERDLLRTASVYRDDEVMVGGSPRLDLIAPEPDVRARVRSDLGVADSDRLVVISGTWGALYRRFHYPIALARLVDRPLPRVHLVVKLHPGEPDDGPYRRTIEAVAAAGGFDPPPLTTVRSTDLYRLLAAADAHLGIHSTVLTEAVAVRTPNLIADGLAAADLLDYVASGVARSIRDGGALLEALEAGAKGALLEADARAFSEAHFEPGSATERIAADLLAWVS